MTKPLGHYTNYTPGDEGVLAEIQEQYGAQLQNLSRAEKLRFIAMIASDLCCIACLETFYSDSMFGLLHAIKRELPISDREGLLQCLINGVRYQK